jgi:hypothetical protein
VYRGSMLLIVFLLELAALAALGWWGFTLDAPAWVRILAGIGAPLTAAVLWAMFAAPRARFAVSGAAVVVVKTVVYLAAAAALVGAGHPVLGVTYLAVVAVVTGLIRLGDLDEGVRPAPGPADPGDVGRP